MSIPNVATLYQRIGSGSEGGHEFARLMKLLLLADYREQGKNFISESDASGDYRRVDAYIPGDEEFEDLIDGFQFKFFPAKLSNRQKNEVESSISAALKENKFIQNFILVTPEDFMKEQQQWFDTLKKKYEKHYSVEINGLLRMAGFALHHWGHTKIIDLILRHDYIGSQYYPELFPQGIGKFKLASATLDSGVCTWLPSQYGNYRFYQAARVVSDGAKTTDPVFDFSFKNSTPDIHLLSKIEIHIERVWSTLKGIPADKLLKSVGTVEHEIDFKQVVNEVSFADPVIFAPHQPMRFKLHLRNFDPHGNWVMLKFWFFFDEITIPTHSFTLSL